MNGKSSSFFSSQIYSYRRLHQPLAKSVSKKYLIRRQKMLFSFSVANELVILYTVLAYQMLLPISHERISTDVPRAAPETHNKEISTRET